MSVSERKRRKRFRDKKLLEENGVKNPCYLDVLFGKMKKNFIGSALEAEFDKHMGYDKHDQNSRNFSDNYWKNKIKNYFNI